MAATALGREADTRTAADVKVMLAEGRIDEARERFADIVARQQRRASRIAYHYVRDAAEADEAVQDAFVRAYTRIASFREELPFEVWFTRILINGCLDRIKARTRRERWIASPAGTDVDAPQGLDVAVARDPSPEDALLARERRERIAWALGHLPDRQRLVFTMSQVEGCSSREVSVATGLNESTVRVHLFRAIRKLRRLLAESPDQQAVTTERRNRALR